MVEADAANDIKGLALQGAVYVDGLIGPMLHQAVPQALSNLQDDIKAVPAQACGSVSLSMLLPPEQESCQSICL